MVEIRYKSNYEVVDVAGKSLADVRKDLRARFDIPEKARIMLNDRKVRATQESEITLHDSDEVRFVVERGGKGALLAGALLMALALTGGVFAFGYLNNSTTLTGVVAAQTDFARVTIPSGAPTWNVFGSTKGQIGSGNLFNVSTQGTSANYTGDITVTVSGC